MRLLIVIGLVFFMMFHHIYSSGCCTCICCREINCSPVKQRPFDTDSCNTDNKCNYSCCQRYPDICFPLPGPGVVDSICQNSTVCNS